MPASTGAFSAGFVYYVSFKGITGANRLDADSLIGPLTKLRETTELPLVVGFGIKDADSAASVAACAQGVVIGSALVALLADADSEAEALQLISEFVAQRVCCADSTGHGQYQVVQCRSGC
jgi:tryptophan synthase alpha chain